MLIEQLLYHSKRNFQIDVLRGMAVIFVLISHYHYFPWLSKGLWAGVDLFFVISGFLISRLIFNEYRETKQFNLKRFYIRRAFRIFPAFYVYLFFTVIFFVVIGKEFTTVELLGEVFFLQNYLGNLLEHTWSLSVEEHFYLIFPVAFLVLTNVSNKYYVLITATIILIFISILAMRFANISTNDYNSFTHHYPTHLRIDSILFGVVLGFLWTVKNQKVRDFISSKVLLNLAMVSITIPFFIGINTVFMNSIGLTLLYLASGFFIVYAIDRDIFSENNKMFRIIAFIGVHSYSIYLWHLLARECVFIILNQIGVPYYNFTSFVSYLILSVLVGSFMSITVERTSLSVRDKYFPRSTKVV